MTLATWAQRLPWSLLAAVIALMGLGWLGIRRVAELAPLPAGSADRQLIWYGLGAGVLLATTLVNYRRLQRISYGLFALSLILLVAVYASPPINGAHRWIRLGPLGIQPSEFAKVACVLAMARYLMFRESYRQFRGLLLPLAMTLVPLLLILKEPDLGTALLFLPVLFAMLFAAGARSSDLARVALVGLLLTPVLWSQMSREQRSRITALWKQTPAGEKSSGDGYQLYQSKQMLALGGWWGSALTGDAVDDPGVYHLPEAHTDFIFSVLGERYGLCGACAVLLLYGLLVTGGLKVAGATREPFGRLLCAGFSALLGVQALVNTGMAVGLLPVTGLSLPMVSYGGSSLIASMLALGLVMNVGMRPGYEVTREPFRW
jgi:cell division protein FtsW (lipid II flippase)